MPNLFQEDVNGSIIAADVNDDNNKYVDSSFVRRIIFI